MTNIIVTSFYKFVDIPNYQDLKEPLLQKCNEIKLKGTILLAKEGVNGSISGSREQIDKYYQLLDSYDYFQNMQYKENIAGSLPFEKMKVRLKKEIVALGQESLDMNNRGDYITPENWDEFISRDDVAVIDTRNDYEFKIGTFKNSINPETESFREFPKWFEARKEELKDKKIAMFCTGGIRCEKSTAYLKSLGHDEVYHLEGGILGYLDKTRNENKKWQGKCFVFDDRCAVDDDLEPSDLYCESCNVALKRTEIELRKNQKRFFCGDCFIKYN